MRTYLAGPMRGIPLFNFPAFDAAAASLRSSGIKVVSPAELDRTAGFDPASLPADWDWQRLPEGFVLQDAIQRDLAALMTCQAIHLLPGWQQSKGATAELALARWLGLGVFEYQPQQRIIGLCGHYGSGKDEAAKALVERGWVRVAFADPLREMALAIDPLIGELRLSNVVASFGWHAAKQHPEVRRFLQRLGTEGVRQHIGNDTWVQVAERSMPADKNVVFTDVRFANEAAMIRERGGHVVRLYRPGHEPNCEHASEQFDFDTDFEIYNADSVEKLHESILYLAGESAISEATKRG